MPRRKTTIEDVRDLGYTVEPAFVADGVTVWRVEGHGLSLMVRDDDQDAIKDLAATHADRETDASVE